MNKIRLTLYIAFSLLLTTLSSHAQEERSDIRKGNKLYNKGEFTEAEVKYKQAIQTNPTSYEAAYNLAGSLYKQNRMEEAATQYSKIIDGKEQVNTANALYNVGNTMVNTRKLDEAIESYKKSLRLNPSDMQTKFNLAYAQKLKAEDEKKNDENKDDKNDDKNQDNKDNDKNQDNKDDKQDEQDKDKDKGDKKDDKKDKDDKKESPPPTSEQQKQNQQILDAIQAAEDKTKDKVDQEKAKAYGVGQGNQW